MAERMYRPAAPFVWIDPDDTEATPNVFHEGLIFRASHPAVKDKPSCFVEITDDNTRGAAAEVEQATAAPGEKRAYVRRNL
jgi:hypothetical protein